MADRRIATAGADFARCDHNRRAYCRLLAPMNMVAGDEEDSFHRDMGMLDIFSISPSARS